MDEPINGPSKAEAQREARLREAVEFLYGNGGRGSVDNRPVPTEDVKGPEVKVGVEVGEKRERRNRGHRHSYGDCGRAAIAKPSRSWRRHLQLDA